MMEMTTTFSNLTADVGMEMTGGEVFPIIGDLITPEQCSEITRKFKGLHPLWNCLEKAQITQQYLGKGIARLGHLYIVSNDYKSSYGYAFNPPYEFHSWVEYEGGIIDLALPGVIQKGLMMVDEVGPILMGRKPVVLAGPPKRWMLYKSYE